MLATLFLVPSLLQPSRRAVLLAPPVALFSAANPSVAASPPVGYDELFSRLDTSALKSPTFTPSGSAIPLLPNWLDGQWDATQTLTRFTTPLGVQFIGAPGRPLSEAEASAQQTRKELGKPVKLQLRWVGQPSGGVVEDRAFNAKSRFDAFAGRDVVKEAAQCDVDPGQMACTLVDFKGPVQQKLLVNALRVGQNGDSLVVSELVRGIFARKLIPGDTRSFPPITTDSETIIELTRVNDSTIKGRLRLASYLQPYDPLYFEANKRAVSLSDYSLELRKSV